MTMLTYLFIPTFVSSKRFQTPGMALLRRCQTDLHCQHASCQSVPSTLQQVMFCLSKPCQRLADYLITSRGFPKFPKCPDLTDVISYFGGKTRGIYSNILLKRGYRNSPDRKKNKQTSYNGDFRTKAVQVRRCGNIMQDFNMK